VARVKVVSENGSGKNLAVTNELAPSQRNNSASIHWDGSAIEELDYFDRSAPIEVPGTGDGEYHIIRMVAGRDSVRPTPQAVRVWVDENPTPVISFNTTGHQPWQDSHPSWWFGVSEANSGTDIYFDWVTGSNAGMFGPGQDDGCASNDTSSNVVNRPSIVHDLTPEVMPTGACCLPFGGGCLQTDYAECAARKGHWGGYGSKCGNYAYGGTCAGYGACCSVAGVCDDTGTFDACTGVFMGEGSKCTDFTACPGICNEPFADADADTDVDQADFAILQQCYTGSADGHPPIPSDPSYCGCFDRGSDSPGDGDIDAYDVGAFELCAGGPGVPADANCGG